MTLPETNQDSNDSHDDDDSNSQSYVVSQGFQPVLSTQTVWYALRMQETQVMGRLALWLRQQSSHPGRAQMARFC